jgi:hypothetical protein
VESQPAVSGQKNGGTIADRELLPKLKREFEVAGFFSFVCASL